MRSEWAPTTWGDIVSLEYGKALRDHGGEGPVRVYGSNGPIGWTAHALVDGPGVILGRKGAYRGVEYSRSPFYVIDTAYYVLPKVRMDLRWLYYAIKYHRLGEIDDGSPIPSTTRAAVYVRELDLPSFEEQVEIAGVLSALDDKIELNRRMSETLEAMVEAIFRDWFVDFGPVRRKLGGLTGPVEVMGGVLSDVRAAAELASSFPDSLDGEGRPLGWSLQPLEEIASFTKGRSYKSAELKPSNVALVTLKSFARGGGYRPDGLKSYVGEYRQDQVVRDGDIVVSQTDVTQAADIIGRPAIVSDSGGFDALVASLDVVIVRPISAKRTPYEYLYQTLKQQRFTDHALSHVTGTTVLHLAKRALPSFEAIAPGTGLAQEFEKLGAPIRRKIIANERENRTLAATRDYLLPRLMSGEVTVREAVQEIAA